MKARVFISCGQATDAERDTAKAVADWLSFEGYDPYVAVQVQTVFDLNQGIIGELKRADYYLFINFPRERVCAISGRKPPFFRVFRRGSLYSHQELAVAYALGFERIIVINHRGFRREGILGALVSNTQEFAMASQVLPLVRDAVKGASWAPAFSRGLCAVAGRWGGWCTYSDHTTWRNHKSNSKEIRAFHVVIENNRPDMGASSAVVRLKEIGWPDGVTRESPDQSHIKASGFAEQYSQTIWPLGRGEVDAFSVHATRRNEIYLHSAMDVSPRNPIIETAGQYALHYEMFAEGFPIRTFTIELTTYDNFQDPTARLLP